MHDDTPAVCGLSFFLLRGEDKNDVVQFLSRIFYVSETEEFAIVRVIRIGTFD